jgi:foldase protein PrsA
MPRAKKTVKKVSKTPKVEMTTTPVMSMPEMTAAPVKRMNNKMLSSALIVVGIALLAYKLGPWAVPAMVAGAPVTRFEVWSRMEKSYGTQTIDDLVNEKVLDKAIAKSGVKVDQAKVDEQMTALEGQFAELGGLDEALKQRGLTRKDLEKQVRTQVAVEEILADKITPTDEEVKAQFDTGAATIYKDKKFDDVKASIADEIKQTKMRDAFLVWFADVKKDVKVKTFGI